MTVKRKRQVENDLNDNIENTAENCIICEQNNNTDCLLVCDHCNYNICHIQCMTPPLDYIPEEDWYCSNCQNNYNLVNNFAPPIYDTTDYDNHHGNDNGADGENNEAHQSDRRGRRGRARNTYTIDADRVIETVSLRNEEILNSRQDRARRAERAQGRRNYYLNRTLGFRYENDDDLQDGDSEQFQQENLPQVGDNQENLQQKDCTNEEIIDEELGQILQENSENFEEKDSPELQDEESESVNSEEKDNNMLEDNSQEKALRKSDNRNKNIKNNLRSKSRSRSRSIMIHKKLESKNSKQERSESNQSRVYKLREHIKKKPKLNLFNDYYESKSNGANSNLRNFDTNEIPTIGLRTRELIQKAKFKKEKQQSVNNQLVGSQRNQNHYGHHNGNISSIHQQI